jgi:hypothetical protein
LIGMAKPYGLTLGPPLAHERGTARTDSRRG